MWLNMVTVTPAWRESRKTVDKMDSPLKIQRVVPTSGRTERCQGWVLINWSSRLTHLKDRFRIVCLYGDNQRRKMPDGVFTNCVSRIRGLPTLLLQNDDIPRLAPNQLHGQLGFCVGLPRPAALGVVAVQDGLALGCSKPGHHGGQVVVEGVGVAQPEHLARSEYC